MPAPIIVSSSSAHSSGLQTTPGLTWSHTVAVGTGRVLLVVPFCENAVSAPPAYSDVTYNGVSLVRLDTVLAAEGSAHGLIEAWLMADPPEGTADIVITGTNASHAGALAVDLSGAEGVPPEVMVKSFTLADSSGFSQAITTLSADSLIIAAAMTNLEASLTISAGATDVITVVGDNAGGGVRGSLAAHAKATAGIQTIDWTSGATFGRAAGIVMAFLPLGAPALVLNDMADDQILQRTSLTACDVPVKGACRNAVTIEARVMQGVSEVVSWTAFPVTLDAFDAILPDVPVGDGYHLEVRSKDIEGTVLLTRSGAATWGVGRVFLVMGSSTPQRWFTDATATPAPSGARKYTGVWSNLTGAAAIAFAVKLMGYEADVPIGLIDTGIGGTALSSWAIPINAEYAACKARAEAAGGVFEGVILHVGSNDARIETVPSISGHEALYRTLVENIRADFSQAAMLSLLPIYLTGCQRAPTLPGTANGHFARARAAEQNVANDLGNFLAATVIDLSIDVDDVHITAADMVQVGRRTAVTWAWATLGIDVDWRGPVLMSATYRADTGVSLAFFELLDGTSLCGRSGLTNVTGFAYSTDGFNSWAPLTGNIIGINAVQLQLPTGLSNVQIAYGYGVNPAISNALFSNAVAP